jgi:hypothetical protein
MSNVITHIEGDILTVTIDLSKDYGPSKSGKTLVVATTAGFTNLGDDRDTSISINCNRYPE